MQEINYIGFIIICILFGMYFFLMLYRLKIGKINRNINSKLESRKKFYVNMFLNKSKVDVSDKGDEERYGIARKIIKNRLHFYRLCSLMIILLISITYIFSFYEEKKVYYRGTEDAKLYKTRLKNLKSIAEIESKTNTRYNAREGKNILKEIKKMEEKLEKNYKEFQMQREFTVIIDPGHGGRDPGAVRKTTYEKDIVLEIAKDIQSVLEKKKINTILTRNTDLALNNFERVKSSLNIHDFVFVSLHINTWRSKNVSGFDIFYYSGKKGKFHHEDSKRFGEIVYGSLSQQNMIKNRNIRDANFGIIKYMNAVGPSLLIEMGFITNDSDYQVFVNLPKRKEFSRKLAEALELYANNFYVEKEIENLGEETK